MTSDTDATEGNEDGPMECADAAFGTGDGRLFVSISEENGRGRLVSELEITACPGCSALVAADEVDRHVRWHRARDCTEG